MENKTCKCGCGMLIVSKWQKYQDINYIKGHARRNTHNSLEHNKIISEKNKNGVFKKCAYCNEDFYVQMSILNRKKYCSKDCYNLAMIGRKIPQESIDKSALSRIGHLVTEETREKISLANSGEKNGMWNDGNGYKPYDKNFTRKFKKLIRQRDNQICMNCGIHREKLDMALHVHHIDYNKMNTIKENCISLCNQCHGLTKINGEYWINLLRNKLIRNYNYCYNNNLTFKIIDTKLKKAGL